MRDSKLGRKLNQFAFLLGIISVFTVIVVTKIPFAFSNFWAEDGAFYQQALDYTFPEDFLISGGGYIIFISRIVANLVSVGPVELAPFMNALAVVAILGIFVQRLYINLGNLIKSRIYKGLISLSVLLLPINNFETIASGTALHFQLLFISLVIALASRESNSISKIDALVISVAILSDPFAAIALIPLIMRPRAVVIEFWKLKPGIAVLLSSSLLVQIMMVGIFHSRGNRSLGTSHSMIKTLYMFLDRVIGSTFIPHWGPISSKSFVGGQVTSQIILRALLGFIIMSLIAFFIIRHLRKNLVQDEIHTKATLLWLVTLPSLYWIFAGFLFNPEPRYAVFPGLSFLMAILILMDHLRCGRDSLATNRAFPYFIMIFVVMTWVLSASPSSRRIDGPNWQNEIIRGKLECKVQQSETISVRILPTDDNWKVELDCRLLTTSLEPG